MSQRQPRTQRLRRQALAFQRGNMKDVYKRQGKIPQKLARIGLEWIEYKSISLIFVFLYTVQFPYFKRIDYRTCRIWFSDLGRSKIGFLEVSV